MTYTITIGWWIIPALITAAVWWPTLSYKSRTYGYGVDVAPILLAAGSMIATLFVWLVYTAIGWWLA